MVKRILILVSLLGWLSLVTNQASPVVAGSEQTPCEGLVPNATATSPVDQVEYKHIPYATFTYSNGNVRVTWPSEYEILEACIVKNWEIIGTYIPGTEVALPIDTRSSRYDFVFHYRYNGGTNKGVTPIWCATAAHLPAPLEGCFENGPSGCSITESMTCAGGSKASVSCEGDSGTCDSGCDSTGCWCSSSTTETMTDSTGKTTTRTTTIKKKQSCPGTPSKG